MHVAIHDRNAVHSTVAVVTSEGAIVELLSSIHVVQALLVLELHPFGGIDQKADGTTRGVDNFLPKLWLHELNQQVNDVLRSAELPVGTRRGQFREHILVQVAADVTVFNVNITLSVPSLYTAWRGC